jgi:hypothetical protein
MDKRIKELAEQAGGIWIEHATAFLSGTLNLERFAELVRQDEREACAKLCESCHWEMMPKEVAWAIRARGNHEQN